MFRKKQEMVDEQILEMDKLNALINAAEKEMLRLKKQYETVVESRNFTGIMLIDRNDELCILYEKANIQEEVGTGRWAGLMLFPPHCEWMPERALVMLPHPLAGPHFRHHVDKQAGGRGPDPEPGVPRGGAQHPRDKEAASDDPDAGTRTWPCSRRSSWRPVESRRS